MTHYTTTLKRLDRPEECVGKTVAAVSRDDRGSLGIRFGDGSWLYGRAEREFDDETTIDYLNNSPDADEALELGLIDRAEYDRVSAAARAEEEKWDRAQLAALQKKLGIDPTTEDKP